MIIKMVPMILIVIHNIESQPRRLIAIVIFHLMVGDINKHPDIHVDRRRMVI